MNVANHAVPSAYLICRNWRPEDLALLRSTILCTSDSGVVNVRTSVGISGVVVVDPRLKTYESPHTNGQDQNHFRSSSNEVASGDPVRSATPCVRGNRKRANDWLAKADPFYPAEISSFRYQALGSALGASFHWKYPPPYTSSKRYPRCI